MDIEQLFECNNLLWSPNGHILFQIFADSFELEVLAGNACLDGDRIGCGSLARWMLLLWAVLTHRFNSELSQRARVRSLRFKLQSSWLKYNLYKYH